MCAILQPAFAAPGHRRPAFRAAGIGLFAAAADWFVGKRPDGTAPCEPFDPATAQRMLPERRHKLFWIRMGHWSISVAPIRLPALPGVLGR